MSAIADLDALRIIEQMLPYMIPSMMALAMTSVVVMVSNAFSDTQKVIFQALFIGAGVTGSITYLTLSAPEKLASLGAFWEAFCALDDAAKFCVTMIAIASAYFGAALYLPPPDTDSDGVSGSSGALLSIATVDKAVDFEVPSSLPAEDTELFEQIFDKLCEEIVEDLPKVYDMKEEATQWVDRMLQYTVAGGKMNRGLAAMAVRKTMSDAQGKTLTPRERVQSAALGWCVEFLQAFFLVADDVMDDSVTRRGQPCWFRLPEVKLIAINDSFLLESCVYKILKRYFGSEKYYMQLVDLFLETTRQTELGQLMDLTSQRQDGKIDLDRFTLERYTDIVRYKTAFYSFYLPVALGMVCSGITDPALYTSAREILLIMGEYFQVQDDFLDCYGAPEVIGKIGTDIQDSKCSWLVVQALMRCSPGQRVVLEDCYGRADAEKEESVKALYRSLDLEDVFRQYEEASYKNIVRLMDESQGLPREVFDFLLKRIYKRAK